MRCSPPASVAPAAAQAMQRRIARMLRRSPDFIIDIFNYTMHARSHNFIISSQIDWNYFAIVFHTKIKTKFKANNK